MKRASVLVLLLLPLLLLGTRPRAVSGGSLVGELGQAVGDLLAPCLAHNASGPWRCLRRESLAAVERLAVAPRIPLLDGISLVRLTDGAGGEPLDKHDLAWRHSVLGSLRRLLRTHLLEIDLARGCTEGQHGPLLTVSFADTPNQALVAPSVGQTEGRHRRRQQMIPMMIFGVTVFGMFIVPIAFQFLTALSGKAFLMAKLALLLASINGLKRVASTGVHYGLYHAVDQYHPLGGAAPHHPPPPLHHPFGGGGGPLLYERAGGVGYAEGPRGRDEALLHGGGAVGGGSGSAEGLAGYVAGGLAPFFSRLAK